MPIKKWKENPLLNKGVLKLDIVVVSRIYQNFQESIKKIWTKDTSVCFLSKKTVDIYHNIYIKNKSPHMNRTFGKRTIIT